MGNLVVVVRCTMYTHLKIAGRRRRKVAELSQEEKEAIMMSDDFHKFFDRTTRLMERAMCEDHQSLFVDYTGRKLIQRK